MDLHKLRNFVFSFLLVSVALVFFWMIFVNPCDKYTPVRADEKRCSCFGKKINFDSYLGNDTDAKYGKGIWYNHCVGVVTLKAGY